MWFRVSGFGFLRVWGLGFGGLGRVGAWGLGFADLGFRV